MFAAIGSAMSAATSPRAVASKSASSSFQGITMVLAVAAAGTPGLAGIPWVSRPEPACGEERIGVAVVVPRRT